MLVRLVKILRIFMKKLIFLSLLFTIFSSWADTGTKAIYEILVKDDQYLEKLKQIMNGEETYIDYKIRGQVRRVCDLSKAPQCGSVLNPTLKKGSFESKVAAKIAKIEYDKAIERHQRRAQMIQDYNNLISECNSKAAQIIKDYAPEQSCQNKIVCSGDSVKKIHDYLNKNEISIPFTTAISEQDRMIDGFDMGSAFEAAPNTPALEENWVISDFFSSKSKSIQDEVGMEIMNKLDKKVDRLLTLMLKSKQGKEFAKMLQEFEEDPSDIDEEKLKDINLSNINEYVTELEKQLATAQKGLSIMSKELLKFYVKNKEAFDHPEEKHLSVYQYGTGYAIPDGILTFREINCSSKKVKNSKEKEYDECIMLLSNSKKHALVSDKWNWKMKYKLASNDKSCSQSTASGILSKLFKKSTKPSDANVNDSRANKKIENESSEKSMPAKTMER